MPIDVDSFKKFVFIGRVISECEWIKKIVKFVFVCVCADGFLAQAD